MSTKHPVARRRLAKCARCSGEGTVVWLPKDGDPTLTDSMRSTQCSMEVLLRRQVFVNCRECLGGGQAVVPLTEFYEDIW
jgi:hypothetical protein